VTGINSRRSVAAAIVALLLAGFVLAAGPQGPLTADASRHPDTGSRVVAPNAATMVAAVRAARQNRPRLVPGVAAVGPAIVAVGGGAPVTVVRLEFAGAPLPRLDRTRAPPT
jgi:hypothetical protein